MALTPKVSVIYESTVSRKRKWHSRLPLFGFIPHKASDAYFVHKFLTKNLSIRIHLKELRWSQLLDSKDLIKNPKTHGSNISTNPIHTVILPDRTLKKWGLTNFAL